MAVELPVLTFTCCDVDYACYLTTAKVHGNIISVVPARCTSDGELFLETIKVFFTRSLTCFPGRAARWAARFVPISIHSWESPPGCSHSQHPFFLHWCLVSPAVAAWCPLFLPSYPLFCCPGQISLLRQMWWVVLVWRRAMELLRHGRCRVKAACRTRYFFFSPLANRWQICYHKALSSYLKERWRLSNTPERLQDAIVSSLNSDMTRNQISRYNCNHPLQNYVYFTARWQSTVCHPFILSFTLLSIFFIKLHG